MSGAAASLPSGSFFGSPSLGMTLTGSPGLTGTGRITVPLPPPPSQPLLGPVPAGAPDRPPSGTPTLQSRTRHSRLQSSVDGYAAGVDRCRGSVIPTAPGAPRLR